MDISAAVLDGGSSDSEAILRVLNAKLLPAAINHMNTKTLEFQMALYDTDCVPTNQRNLTDVRTRMGVLLEYELAKAINDVLPGPARDAVVLTYVIANKYPDLAFRGCGGRIGVRFEVKSLQGIAEEKSANFETLIKDIRKGTDFVLVLLWEWRQSRNLGARHPYVEAFAVLDAYDLAVMRDCYWLNTPPDVGDARQGFDLCFGVNANAGRYNKEENNYGKLMRIFDPKFEQYLPNEVRERSTLEAYFDFRGRAMRVGIQTIGREIGAAYIGASMHGSIQEVSVSLPAVFLIESIAGKLLVVAGIQAPKKQTTVKLMAEYGVGRAMLFNGKFQWSVRGAGWERIASGKKPAAAMEWAKTAVRS